MTKKTNSNIHLALLHFPVYNKHGEIVTSSVTTLDIHDISRICKTFEVGSFYIVTPLKTQQVLVDRMIQHWLTGYGANYNPTRREALLKTAVKPTLDQVIDDLKIKCGQPPRTIVTGAKRIANSTDYQTLRKELENRFPFLFIFGTGWGLEKGLVQRADFILAPIEGQNEYNHLPVRAAIAIILDRLLTSK